jgi:hypothetical protein
MSRAAQPENNNLLAQAQWLYSRDDGQTWNAASPVIAGGTDCTVLAKTTFRVADPKQYFLLELTHGLPLPKNVSVKLNGQDLPTPAAWMEFETYPAIPASLLVKGDNRLEVRCYCDNRPPRWRPERKMPDVTLTLARKLIAVKRQDAGLLSGALLGPPEANAFSVSCRTRAPLPVTLTLTPANPLFKPLRQASPAGLIHRFRVEPLDEQGRWSYSLAVDSPDLPAAPTPPHPVRFLPRGPNLRFVLAGDCRTNSEAWGIVAAAIGKARPQFVVFSGDMTINGDIWDRWEDEFFKPAAGLLATVPFYTIMGNHEGKGLIYDQLFFSPGSEKTYRNWRQQVGDVLLVGIDGQEDWSQGSDNLDWLEAVLAMNQARFVFVFNHYPPYSSGWHGTEDEEGEPSERECLQARENILPLLGQYHVTAMICGHEHDYERMEPPQTTVIIAGGGGAPLWNPAYDARAGVNRPVQNPYLKVFNSTLNFCVVEVKGDSCTLTAQKPDGQVLDTRTWKARPLPATHPAATTRPAAAPAQ